MKNIVEKKKNTWAVVDNSDPYQLDKSCLEIHSWSSLPHIWLRRFPSLFIVGQFSLVPVDSKMAGTPRYSMWISCEILFNWSSNHVKMMPWRTILQQTASIRTIQWWNSWEFQQGSGMAWTSRSWPTANCPNAESRAQTTRKPVAPYFALELTLISMDDGQCSPYLHWGHGYLQWPKFSQFLEGPVWSSQQLNDIKISWNKPAVTHLNHSGSLVETRKWTITYNYPLMVFLFQRSYPVLCSSNRAVLPLRFPRVHVRTVQQLTHGRTGASLPRSVSHPSVSLLHMLHV